MDMVVTGGTNIVGGRLILGWEVGTNKHVKECIESISEG